ncbi:MAG: right-handed parallel beta-helix repeat-containing protein [Akkermansiaceae bacterium]
MCILRSIKKNVSLTIAAILLSYTLPALAQSVSNLSELQAFLSLSEGGETILLEPGDYGDLEVKNRSYTSFVTIRSKNDSKPAVFNSVSIEGSSFLRLDNIILSNSSNGSISSSILSISDSSEAIEFINSEAHGPIDDDYSGHRIIDIEDSKNVLIQSSFMHNGFRVIVLSSSEDIIIIDNTFEDIGGDEIKIINIDGLTIENNTGATRKHPVDGDHVDFIQGESVSSRSIIIRDNVSLPEISFTQQGIFLSDVTFHDVLIENNLIYSELIRAIQVDDGSTDITIRNNTLFDVPEITSTKASSIFAPSDATVENNVYTSSINNAGFDGTNLVIQHTHPNSDYFYNDHYINPFAGIGVTIHDLRPIDGQTTEGLGAFEKINDLLDEVEDSDKDGVRDSWERLHFSNLSATDGSGDSDGDGTNDFLEFLQNTNPNSHDPERFILDVETNSEGVETQFSWSVDRKLHYGIDYELQVSADLITWQEPDESDYTLKTVQAGSDRERLTVTLLNPASSRVFARVSQVRE